MNNGQIAHSYYPIRVDSIYITCMHKYTNTHEYKYMLRHFHSRRLFLPRFRDQLYHYYFALLFFGRAASFDNSFLHRSQRSPIGRAQGSHSSWFHSISTIETDVNNNHKYYRYSIEKMSSIRYERPSVCIFLNK